MKYSYMVIGDEDKEKFEKRVEQYLQIGYSIAGGVQVNVINNKIYYFQSIYGVIKDKKTYR